VYEPSNTLGGGANAGYTSLHNSNGVWQDNYLINGKRGFAVAQWDRLTFQNNFVYSANTTGRRDNDSLISIERLGNPLSGYNFNNNTYYDNTTIESTCPEGPHRRIPFADDRTVSDCNGTPGGPLDWNGWAALGGAGWESGSTYTAGAPTSTVVLVRPNLY